MLIQACAILVTMDSRTLRVLEFDKIRERMARHASFSLGRERVLALLPTDDMREAQGWQAETREARTLLEEKSDVHLGGVHDSRSLVEQAVRGATLLPMDLLDIRSTLVRARTLHRLLTRLSDQFPHIADVAARIATPGDLIEEIPRCIDERGEVLDSASDALARIRRTLREAHGALMERLQRIVASSTNAPYLQEPIVTQRQGRYVIPLHAEFKGRIPGLVHDQSGSGATLFIEPLAVVDLNNRWREAQLAEDEEIHRILAALTGLVAAHAGVITRTVEALGDLDLIFAKARYANELRATEPELVAWQDSKGARGRGSRGEEVRMSRRAGEPGSEGATSFQVPSFWPPASRLHPAFIQARHPLLDPLTVVPVDIYLEDDYFVLLITGPNTGGKTVSLKTTGLLTLMAQAGMAIPANEGSKLSVFEQVLADIGDEQSIEQSLSTFSSHMTHIVEILERVDSRSLVLLDELGAGTDPEEGAALAQSLLRTLLARRITTLATTHYSELMDEDRPTVVVHRVDQSILVGESHGEEPGKVADQPLPATGIRRHLLPEDDLELLLQTRRELATSFAASLVKRMAYGVTASLRRPPQTKRSRPCASARRTSSDSFGSRAWRAVPWSPACCRSHPPPSAQPSPGGGVSGKSGACRSPP